MTFKLINQCLFTRYGGADMIDSEKLYGLLPNYIPDYCLQPSNDESASNHWHSLIIQAYQKVFDNTICFLNFGCFYTRFIINVLEYLECNSIFFAELLCERSCASVKSQGRCRQLCKIQMAVIILKILRSFQIFR